MTLSIITDRFATLIDRLTPKNIIARAFANLMMFASCWLCAATICFFYITTPFTAFLYGSIMTILIAGAGLLLFLDPVEKEKLGRMQELRWKLLKILSEQYNCKVNDIIGRSKQSRYVDPRCLFAYVIRKNSDMTLVEIGAELSISHASVAHLIQRAEDLLYMKNTEACKAMEIINEKLFNQK